MIINIYYNNQKLNIFNQTFFQFKADQMFKGYLGFDSNIKICIMQLNSTCTMGSLHSLNSFSFSSPFLAASACCCSWARRRARRRRDSSSPSTRRTRATWLLECRRLPASAAAARGTRRVRGNVCRLRVPGTGTPFTTRFRGTCAATRRCSLPQKSATFAAMAAIH